MKKNTFLWKNEIFDIKMQFSSILCKTIQLYQKWCYLAEIWSRSSQDGNKQFQVAFIWYFEYFSRYGKYRAKNAEILQNLAFFGIFFTKKMPYLKKYCKYQQKATWNCLLPSSDDLDQISAKLHHFWSSWIILRKILENCIFMSNISFFSQKRIFFIFFHFLSD